MASLALIWYFIVEPAINFQLAVPLLVVIIGLAEWPVYARTVRASVLGEKNKEYVEAARVIGLNPRLIMIRHILPNTIATMMTFVPFTVVSAITAITALDFLGWGLPPLTPSIGELLKQGTANLTTAPWIVTAAFVTLVFILAIVTFIGEAVREAFDPRKFTLYR